jgi:hypothetical protein
MTDLRWRDDNDRWLATRLHQLRLRMEAHAASTRHQDGRDPASWWLVADGVPASPRSEPERRLDDELAAIASEMSRPPALLATAAVAGLGPLETDLLLLAACTSYDGGFAIACAELHGDARRDHPTPLLGLQLFAEPGDRLRALDVLLPHAPLRRLRLVELGDDQEPLLLQRIAVDERIADYLRGVNHVEARLTPYLTELRADGDTSYVDTTAGRVREVVLEKDDRWVTVNITGPEDCGASDVVVRAAESLNLRPAVVELDRLAANSEQERRVLLGLMAREALLAGFGYVVQCPEPGSDNAWLVDELVRGLGGPLFLLSAQPWPTREDVVVVPLSPVSTADQGDLWRRALNGVPNTVNGEIDAIVHHFDLGPAAIGATVHRASAMRGQGSVDGRDLWRAARDQATDGLQVLADKIEPGFAWEDLVLDGDATAQLHQLADQVRQRSLVYDQWGFAPHRSQGRGISAMFSGASGTGKTMAAEILAGELELDLLRVNLAGIVSKYVGETSKNLHRIFDAAQRSGAILLFDEADALFGTRTEVRDSHDRYAVLEINHLLQLMQDYRGLAILATNRRSAVDGAFLRRLRFVIEFGFPGPAERALIWQRSFPAQADCDELDFGRLSRLEIPGGNIRSITLNAAFLAASAARPITMADIASAARLEYAKIGRPLNADDLGTWAVSA